MKLLWKNIEKGAFHLARHTKTPSKPTGWHTHDFAEMFWVDSGEGAHELEGGNVPLKQGDLVFIRPSDYHGLRSQKELRITNLAFSLPIYQDLRSRYSRHFPWRKGAKPPVIRINDTQLAWLNSEADKLYTFPRERFYLERFVINVMYVFREAEKSILSDEHSAPEWLIQACLKMNDPRVFREGVSAMVKAAGRSPEHLARTMRQTMKITPSEYVNSLRMKYAAEQLSMSGKKIIEISLDCGFDNLSHFYRLFRRHFGKSPHAWRKQAVL